MTKQRGHLRLKESGRPGKATLKRQNILIRK